jgi:hypothetical protein
VRPSPLEPPGPSEEDVQASIRRVRRGCYASALIFVALTVVFISATGNLALLLLLIIPVAMIILARSVE